MWYARVIGHDLALVGAVLVYVLSLIIRDDWFRDTFRFTLQSLAAAIVILYGMFPGNGLLKKLLLHASMWKPVAIIGLASYSMYLINLIMNEALAGLVDGWPLPIRVIALTVAGVLAGLAVYYAVEVPVLRWRNRQKKGAPISIVEETGRDTAI